MTIEQISHYANLAAFGIVMLFWFVFAGTFLLRKKPTESQNTKREPLSWAGLALQGAGFGIVWVVRRTPFGSPLIDTQFAINIVLQIVALILAVISVWLAMAAIKELGKQWSLQARLIEGHKLITTGVYQIVRHPIYTAMLGMLLATGIVFSHWVALVAAVIIFLIGTKIRTSIEEGLLRDAFGNEFEEWKKNVPGLIPFLKPFRLK